MISIQKYPPPQKKICLEKVYQMLTVVKLSLGGKIRGEFALLFFLSAF